MRDNLRFTKRSEHPRHSSATFFVTGTMMTLIALLTLAPALVVIPSSTAFAVGGLGSHPITLDEAISIAFANSLILESARLDVEEAKLNLKQAEANHLMNPSPATLVEARQMLDIARQQLILDEFDLKRQVEEDYYAVLRAYNLAGVAREATDLTERQLDIAEQRLESGTETRADVLSATGDVADARANLAQAEGGYELALLNFRRTLGVELDSAYTPMQSEFQIVEVDYDVEADIAFALQHRLEIMQLLTVLQSAKTQVQLADNDYTPEIALQGARLAVDKITTQLSLLQSGIQLEIRQAYLAMSDQTRRISALETRVEAAEEMLRVANQLYDLNMAPIVQVMGAQTALSQAKSDYIHAIFDYNLAKSRYDRAVARPLKDFTNTDLLREGVRQ